MRINEQIRIAQVRLFDDTTDEALGIVAIDQARQLAVERGLDLVEVAPAAQPPVCRLMDYGRFKFEALKREKDSRRDHNVVQLKEQKLRPKISDNDFRTKLAKVKQFLGEGDKVKLTIMFRGREMVHQEFGRRLLDRMTAELRDMAVIERSPLVEGRNMIMILSPTAKKHARGSGGHEERPRPHGEAEHSNGASTAVATAPASAQLEPRTRTPADPAATVTPIGEAAPPATAAGPAPADGPARTDLSNAKPAANPSNAKPATAARGAPRRASPRSTKAAAAGSSPDATSPPDASKPPPQ